MPIAGPTGPSRWHRSIRTSRNATTTCARRTSSTSSQFPEITFESTHAEAIDDESSRVTGNLTMHGITREITLDVLIQGTDTDPWGNTRAGLEVIGKLNRKDFDMQFNQALGSGNLLVGDKVGVTLDISAVLQPS